jgi:xanthine dehydrogenase accessory factor
LLTATNKGTPAAWCRLVETRGSTPQKAGAGMLVYADGSQAGTLGGGCVEADVKRQALAAIQHGRAELADFQLDSDYGWDDGLICGGRMRVLIDPLADSGAKEYYHGLAQLHSPGDGGTEAIAFASSDPHLPLGASLVFDANANTAASIRLPRPEETAVAQIRAGLKPLDERPLPYLNAGVAYLPVLPRCRLLIVGGGHVGQAVAELAQQLEFDVWIVDDREEIVSASRFPHAQRRISGPIGATLSEIEITSRTYCLIVTRGHNHDEEALGLLADRGAAYVGMIGSRRKIKLIFADLLDAGLSQEVLDRVHAPVGLDIGSQTVPEIAVSIAAQLIAIRNQRQG